MWQCPLRWFLLLSLVINLFLLILHWRHHFSPPSNDDARTTTKVVVVVHSFSNERPQYEWANGWANCSLAKCLELRKCLLNYGRRLSIHVQPILHVLDEAGHVLDCAEPSIEFLAMRHFLLHSNGFHEADPAKACLILPGIDTFSLLECQPERIVTLLEAAKSLLPPRSNFLLLNFLASPQYLRRPFPFPAIFASAQHSPASFRPAIDLAIPLPLAPQSTIAPPPPSKFAVPQIDILAIFDPSNPFAQLGIVETFEKATNWFRHKFGMECPEGGDNMAADALLRPICDLKSGRLLAPSLDQLILSSTFLLVSDAVPFPQMLIWQALRFGAVPVIISDKFVAPFGIEIDWSRFSLHFVPSLLPHLPRILHSLSAERIGQMRRQGLSIFERHFSSLDAILEATMVAIEGRIVPGRVRTKAEWNFGLPMRGPPMLSAKCQIGHQQQPPPTTIGLLIVDHFEQDAPAKGLSNFLQTAKIHKFVLFCQNANCDAAENAFSAPLPRLQTFQIGEGQPTTTTTMLAEHIPRVVRQSSSSSYSTALPAIFLVNTSHPFWRSNSSSHPMALAHFLQVWAHNCHSLLLFPSPPDLGPNFAPNSIIFGSALAIVHRHLLAHFLSPPPPPPSFSCTSTRHPLLFPPPLAADAHEIAIALCHFQPPKEQC